MHKTLQELLEQELVVYKLKLVQGKTRPTVKRLKLDEKSTQLIQESLKKEVENGRKIIRAKTEFPINETLYASISEVKSNSGNSITGTKPHTYMEIWVRKYKK